MLKAPCPSRPDGKSGPGADAPGLCHWRPSGSLQRDMGRVRLRAGRLRRVPFVQITRMEPGQLDPVNGLRSP
jgi:hypothetical protein